MSQLYDAVAFDVFGNPKPIAPAPELRVHGESITAGQLREARTVFQGYCNRVAALLGPAPVQNGALMDGSTYKIFTVGRSRYMQLWPKGSSEDEVLLGGIAVRALRGDVATLYVLRFVDSAWELEAPDTVYGGMGLWSSTAGGYLTDGSFEPRSATENFIGTTIGRHDAESTLIPAATLDAAMLLGLAYRAPKDRTYASVNRRNEVIWCARDNEKTVHIYSMPAADQAVIAQTPDEFVPGLVFDEGEFPVWSGDLSLLTTAVPVFANRLRGQDRVEFAMGDFKAQVVMMPELFRYRLMSDCALTHLANIQTGRPLAVSVEAHASTTVNLRAPSEPDLAQPHRVP